MMELIDLDQPVDPELAEQRLLEAWRLRRSGRLSGSCEYDAEAWLALAVEGFEHGATAHDEALKRRSAEEATDIARGNASALNRGSATFMFECDNHKPVIRASPADAFVVFRGLVLALSARAGADFQQLAASAGAMTKHSALPIQRFYQAAARALIASADKAPDLGDIARTAGFWAETADQAAWLANLVSLQMPGLPQAPMNDPFFALAIVALRRYRNGAPRPAEGRAQAEAAAPLLPAQMPNPAALSTVDAGTKQINGSVLLFGPAALDLLRALDGRSGGAHRGGPSYMLFGLAPIRGWTTRLHIYALDDAFDSTVTATRLALLVDAVVLAQTSDHLAPALVALGNKTREGRASLTVLAPKPARDELRSAGIDADFKSNFELSQARNAIRPILSRFLAQLRG